MPTVVIEREQPKEDPPVVGVKVRSRNPAFPNNRIEVWRHERRFAAGPAIRSLEERSGRPLSEVRFLVKPMVAPGSVLSFTAEELREFANGLLQLAKRR